MRKGVVIGTGMESLRLVDGLHRARRPIPCRGKAIPLRSHPVGEEGLKKVALLRRRSDTSCNSIGQPHYDNAPREPDSQLGPPHEEASPSGRARPPLPPATPGSAYSGSAAEEATTAAPATPFDPWVPLRSKMSSIHDREILELSLPALLSLASDPLMSIVDTAYVGRLGAEELAALGLNTALFGLSFVVFNFLATATTPAIAKATASGDTATSGRLVWQAGALATVLGTMVWAALAFGSVPALQMVGLDPADDTVRPLAQEYLFWRAAAAPANLLCTVGQGAMRGLKDMRGILRITAVSNAANFILDPILIFGLGWGIGGAAIATTAAQYAATALFGVALHARREQLGLWPPPTLRLSTWVSDAAPLLMSGGAVLARTALLLGTKTLATVVAARIGTSSVAAHQVVGQLWTLFSLMVDSLAVSGQALVAVKLGQGNQDGARAVSERLIELGVALGIVCALVFGAVSPEIPWLFTEDAEVSAAIMAVLPIAIAVLPINAVAYVLDGVLVGAEEYAFLAKAMAISAAATAIALSAVEPLHLGLPGVWGAMSVLMMLRGATLMYGFRARFGTGEGGPGAGPGAGGVIDVEARQVAASPAPSTSGDEAPCPSPSPSPPEAAAALPEGVSPTELGQGGDLPVGTVHETKSGRKILIALRGPLPKPTGEPGGGRVP